MKKFIAPTIRVIKYESNIICESGNPTREDSGSIGDYTNPENQESGDGWNAPSRRIFGE